MSSDQAISMGTITFVQLFLAVNSNNILSNWPRSSLTINVLIRSLPIDLLYAFLISISGFSPRPGNILLTFLRFSIIPHSSLYKNLEETCFSFGPYLTEIISFSILFPVARDALTTFSSLNSWSRFWFPLTQIENFLVIDELGKCFFLSHYCVINFFPWASCSWHILTLNLSTRVVIVFIFLTTVNTMHCDVLSSLFYLLWKVRLYRLWLHFW